MRQLTYTTRDELLKKLHDIKETKGHVLHTSFLFYSYYPYREKWIGFSPEECEANPYAPIEDDEMTTEELADYIIDNPDLYEYSHD